MRNIYVRGTGQDDNIGDVILRRSFFDELSKAGRLHILLGDASVDFTRALELRDSDVIYRDMDGWRRSAYRSVLRQRTWLVDKPGELLLEEDIYKGQRRLLPLILAVRARGGRSLRLGIGQRRPNEAVMKRFRRLYRLSSLVAWRDVASHAHFGIGQVMPDWGFLPGSAPHSSNRRSRLVISYRSDSQLLNPVALKAIRDFAARQELVITVVTQVGRDSARSKDLHRQLGGELVDWEAVENHLEQESRLRSIYRESVIALSDRLHVLIVASTEGAVPVNLIAEPDLKVSRHFEAIDYNDVTVSTDGESSESLIEALESHVSRSQEISRKIAVAQARIREVAHNALSTRS